MLQVCTIWDQLTVRLSLSSAYFISSMRCRDSATLGIKPEAAGWVARTLSTIPCSPPPQLVTSSFFHFPHSLLIQFLWHFSNQETPISSGEAIKLIVRLQLHFYDILSLTFGTHTHTHVHAAKHTHKHTIKHTLSLSLMQTHLETLFLTHLYDVSLSHTHTHVLSHYRHQCFSLSLTHTHTHTHTHAHWQGYFCHCLRA